MSVSSTVAAKEAETGPTFVTTRPLNALSEIFVSSLHPGMQARKTSGSFNAAQTRWRDSAISCCPSSSIVTIRNQAAIALADGLIGQQFGAGALMHEPALVEDIGAIRDFEREFDILLDQKQADPRRASIRGKARPSHRPAPA